MGGGSAALQGQPWREGEGSREEESELQGVIRALTAINRVHEE